MSKLKKEDGYTGKKHKNYIWIPKPKSDLKEYRDILKLCKEIEDQYGYFNDASLGIAQVNKGSIFDGSLDSAEYVKKYKDKSTGNQSYISNARMSIRMSRWFGWITRINGEKAKYKLTDRGKFIANFSGRFPATYGNINEFDIFLFDVIGLRFYSVNDSPAYQNKKFKQRVMVNILRFLSKYKFMHNYEIVITALTLKTETKKNIDIAFERMERLKNGDISISDALRECDIDPNDNSSLTGVYDGPKVLCSLLKQLNLVETTDATKLGKNVLDYYKSIYKGSLIRKPPKNVFKMTDFAEKMLKTKLSEIPIWYEDFPTSDIEHCVGLLLSQEGNLEDKMAEKLHLKPKFLENYINKDNIDFVPYRDIPPEKDEEVMKLFKKVSGHLIEQEEADLKDRIFVPNDNSIFGKCIKCHPPRCNTYKEFINVPNSSDYLACKLCPNDALDRNVSTGYMEINDDKCSKCMLCAFYCPVNAIDIVSDKMIVATFPNAKSKEYAIVENDISELSKVTDDILESYGNKAIGKKTDRVRIAKLFESEIDRQNQHWAQDQFYTWVRNVFRALGLSVKYTGGKGMKTRSDVTIDDPFIAAMEVKSPAEGKVTGKAVRQTFDASVQLSEKYKQTIYMAAIGQEISSESIRKANQYKTMMEKRTKDSFCIPLIPSKSLIYLFLINEEINVSTNEIENIFKYHHGEFGKESLRKFLSDINSSRKLKNLKVYLEEIEDLF